MLPAMRFLLRHGCAALFLVSVGWSAEWPEFRGPSQNGIVDAELPLTWGEEENIRWKTPIHGRGWSTPLIAEGKIWVTTATEDGHRLSVLCLDAATGEVLLDRVLATIDNPELLYNQLNCYASPSGVIEEGRVWVTFGSYGTFCLDTQSYEVLWQRRDLSCSHWRGAGTSLAMWQDRLIVSHDGSDQQYSVALDKFTGKTLWRRDRSTDYQDDRDGLPANSGDFRKAYSTPIFVPVGDQVQMILNSSKACWSYDVKTGEELWQVPYDMHSPSSRSVYCPETGLLYTNTGLGKAEIWAIRLEPGMRGNVKDSHLAWTYFRRTPKRSSPVVLNGLLFMANDGVLTCIDARTGNPHWSERAGGEYSASLLATKERVYCFDEDGLCTVIKASAEFERLAENRLDAGFMASPAVLGKALILRTKTHLYRVE